jgi:putative addiction module component (TIGR02574 family)
MRAHATGPTILDRTDELMTGFGSTDSLLDEQQKATIRRRASEMEADPTLGVPWDEVYAELMADLR